MLFCHQDYKIKKFIDINDELSLLEGELDNETCKVTLAKFLRYNLHWTVDLMANVKLAPYQVVALKAMFLRNYSLFVFGRGCAKSYMSAVAAFFLCIFEPGTNIIVAAPTFRAGKNIFAYMEKIAKSPEAILLQQCLGVKSKRNDLFEWEINGGSVKILPCNGDKLRGFRASVLILDEYRLLSEDMVKNVLIPFLVSPQNLGERMRIREIEDDKIRKGLMTEDDRMEFANSSRMICLSSASFTFENLYKTYSEWYDKIVNPKKENPAKYFIQQVSWDAVPTDFQDKVIIAEAKSSDETHPSFQREYCAQFVDGSDGYFSAKKMHNLTVKDGEKPTVLIKGQPNKEYYLAIDPNFSQSQNADHFAMCVLEKNDNDTVTVVHNYAVAGVELAEHIKYFHYLLNAFNIIAICCDNADGNFIASANESSLFQDSNIKLDFVDYDGELIGDDFIKMVKTCRNQYNLGSRKICFKHIFNQNSIRRINEQLQTWINTNRILFGSKLTQSDDYNTIIQSSVPYKLGEGENMSEFVYDLISTQDDTINLTKKECALIEVKVSPTGGQVFDLPGTLRRNSSANRSRRDSYTALLLAVECANAYSNIMRQATKEPSRLWTPQMIGNSTY